MKCQACQQEEATVHLTQVIDGAVKKMHLCEACAAQSGFDVHSPMSITDVLLGLGGTAGGAKPATKPAASERVCPVCHLRRTDFKKTGRLGCPACYEEFKDELAPLLKAMHRHDRHQGKVPERDKGRVQVTEEMEDLQRSLERAIATENYEEAARLRDALQALRDAQQAKKADS